MQSSTARKLSQIPENSLIMELDLIRYSMFRDVIAARGGHHQLLI